MYKFVVPLILLLSGCTLLQQDKPTGEEIGKKLRIEALSGYEYALMAENAYWPNNVFSLPAYIKSEPSSHYDNDDIGLAYSLFKRVDGYETTEIIIAFRGTENDRDFWNDWWYGNILAKQNHRGLEVFRDYRKKYPDTDITVVGHSLGGAIALHISLREENVKTFVFNTSSRFTRGNDPKDNDRHSYSEYADVNKVLRATAINPRWEHNIYSCTYGNPIKNHKMAPLAACLVVCASYLDPIKPKMVMEKNPDFFKDNIITGRACTL